MMKSSIVNTNSQHNEIHWANGKVSKQLKPFGWETADWNCDGDVHDEYGALFEGKYGGTNFYAVWELEDLVSDGEATIKMGE